MKTNKINRVATQNAENNNIEMKGETTMTNDNQFKPTNQHFKELRNLPQTETRIVLNDWSQEAKKSKLSPVARNKVINRSGSNYLSENKGYGPCSYSGCPHSTPFNVSITIEGKSRNWANTG